jgi:hypothetical protein
VHDELDFTPQGPQPASLGHNGTYLVVRKLAQDVAAFRTLLRDVAGIGHRSHPQQRLCVWPHRRSRPPLPARCSYPPRKSARHSRQHGAAPDLALRLPLWTAITAKNILRGWGGAGNLVSGSRHKQSIFCWPRPGSRSNHQCPWRGGDVHNSQEASSALASSPFAEGEYFFVPSLSGLTFLGERA